MVFVVIFGLALCLAAFFLAGLALATALNSPSQKPKSDGQSTQKHQTLVTVVVSQDGEDKRRAQNVACDARPSVFLHKTQDQDSLPHPHYAQAASFPHQPNKGCQLIKVS